MRGKVARYEPSRGVEGARKRNRCPLRDMSFREQPLPWALIKILQADSPRTASRSARPRAAATGSAGLRRSGGKGSEGPGGPCDDESLPISSGNIALTPAVSITSTCAPGEEEGARPAEVRAASFALLQGGRKAWK